MRKRGSVLVGLLWCLALLAVIVTGVLHTARLDLLVAKNHSDAIQAYYLAVAGAEKAKALIYHESAERKRAARNHSGNLYDAPDQFQEVRLGRGAFSVLRQDSFERGGRLVYGISDEESRLNINDASLEEIQKLYAMTPEVAAAILDWRDQDSNVSEGGAEADDYAAQQPPYLPRDGRIQTARELLGVRGAAPQLLLGEDANQNGILDPEEDDGEASYPPDNADGRLDAGWSGLIAFESPVQNKNAAGESRVDVQNADEAELTRVQGITPQIAKAIVDYRGQNRLENLADLLEVTAMTRPPSPPPQQPGESQPGQPAPGRPAAPVGRAGSPAVRSGSPSAPGTPGEGQPAAAAQPQPAAQPTGPKLIDEDLFLEIADELTTSSETAHRGLVNINTAPQSVLVCLPGITEELAHAIVSYRGSAGFFPNIAWLLRVPGLSQEIFKQVAPKVTARSENFRIVSEGRIPSTGAIKRIELIVRLSGSYVDVISYREDL